MNPCGQPSPTALPHASRRQERQLGDAARTVHTAVSADALDHDRAAGWITSRAPLKAGWLALLMVLVALPASVSADVALHLSERARVTTTAVASALPSKTLTTAGTSSPGRLQARRITKVFVTPDQEVLDLSVIGDDGHVEVLQVTPSHPFHVAEGRVRPAGGPEDGEHIGTGDGRSLVVVGKVPHATRETVYNLEVEGLHTYFVGEHCAWVHNECTDIVPWRPENPNAKPYKPGTWYWKEDMPGHA